MRIAIYHNLPSGGAKRTLYESTRRLTRKHHIDIFTLTCANHDFADVRPFVVNYDAFAFRPLPLLSSPLGRLNQAIRLVDLYRLRFLSTAVAGRIEQGAYDIVLVHPCQFENSPSVLKHLRNHSSVYYCHEPLRRLYEEMPLRTYERKSVPRQQILNRVDPLPAIYHRVLKDVDQRNLRSANSVLVNSEFTRIAVHRIYQVDAQVSYHGVDVDRFQPMDVEKRHMVLSVGSLTPLKGFDFLIRAVANIQSDHRPTLVIASNYQDPLERDFLEHLSSDLDVDLELLSNVSDDRLVELYNLAKVTLYAPVGEPFGLVPLESMSCGTPVIGVREGGIPETIVHKHTGLLVERDPTKFATAVQYLLDDSSVAAEYGLNARDHIEKNWTWEQATATLERHLIQYTGV